MILREATIFYAGYDPDELKPRSNKRVCCVCDNCGRVKWKKMLDYTNRRNKEDLCIRCACNTPEFKNHIVVVHTGRIRSHKTREKMRENHADFAGENHHNWQGGISFEPYCQKFNEAFKESIREKFGRVCFLCPTTEDENGRKLGVHHVNYNKDCLCDDVKCDFVPLCNSCHAKTNFNRGYWKNRIIEKLITNEV